MRNPWDEYVLPRLTDHLLRNDAVGRQRERVAAELSGEIVEIGFGSGLNVPHYPSAVTRVVAIEPSATARGLAAQRIADAPVRIDFAGLDGQRLPLPDNSMDGALSTFTLCTIPDASRALSEIQRVLKPGGTFAFVEHGLSPATRVAHWQHRLNSTQRRVAGGCNLDRRIDVLIAQAGLEHEWMVNERMPGPGLASPWGYLYLGVAIKPE